MTNIKLLIVKKNWEMKALISFTACLRRWKTSSSPTVSLSPPSTEPLPAYSYREVYTGQVQRSLRGKPAVEFAASGII